MVIDFHTHVFPPAMAEKALAKLSATAESPAFFDGTADGLLVSMREAGIDRSVILPIAARPHNFESVNRYARELNRVPGLISFGSVHPYTPDLAAHVRQLKEMGFRGIKVHPDYQGVYFDDPAFTELAQACAREGLLLLTHAGYDPLTREDEHCTQDMLVRMLEAVPEVKLIAAHVGGDNKPEAVEEKLCGQDLYMDISWFFTMPDDTFRRIVEKHGADRFLFATDGPWAGQKETLARFRALGFDPETEEKILWKNALRLLGEA